ncbi:hypothetical protein [Paraburkholderia youngii]|uniref:hypothetical protein n=1 Tax=Paraburkholderia youngii TaxID=2782701 RepID=UPI003D229051
MDSSMHSRRWGRPAEIRRIYRVSHDATELERAAARIPLRRQISRAQTVEIDFPKLQILLQRLNPDSIAARAQALGERSLIRPVVTSGIQEPRTIQFLDGPDSDSRRDALRARLRQRAAPGQQMLVVSRKPVELHIQINRIAGLVVALQLIFPGRPVLVGIDAIDQDVTSHTDVAIQLRKLASMCDGIVCTVDGRYGDSRMLIFCLRSLGVTVFREPLSPPERTGGYAVREMARTSAAVEPPAVVHHSASRLYEFLYADQREVGSNAHSSVNSLRLEVCKGPGFRPDFRSIVERRFGISATFLNSSGDSSGLHPNAGCSYRRRHKRR